MTKLILLRAINLARYLSYNIFERWMAPWTTTICLDRLDFFLKLLATVVTLFWQTGQVGEWQVIWCLGSQQIIHDVGSLCISTMLFLNIFLLGKTLKQGLPKRQLGPRGILLSCPPAPPTVLNILLIPPLPLHHLLIIILLLLLPSSSFSPYRDL